jgi:hypothetical protein
MSVLAIHPGWVNLDAGSESRHRGAGHYAIPFAAQLGVVVGGAPERFWWVYDTGSIGQELAGEDRTSSAWICPPTRKPV